MKSLRIVLFWIGGAATAAGVPLPVGIQELSFSFSFSQAGWGEVKGYMIGEVSDHGANDQLIYPLNTAWKFDDPSRQTVVHTYLDSYPAFSYLQLNDGNVVGGYLNLIVYDPNMHYYGTLPEGADFADFQHRLRWNYGGGSHLLVSGGWMLHGGDPDIDQLVYSHSESGPLAMTIGLRAPDTGSSAALLASALIALGVLRRARAGSWLRGLS